MLNLCILVIFYSKELSFMGFEWFSHIVDEYWHLSKLNYAVFNSYSSE
jgi:hypothetical protein